MKPIDYNERIYLRDVIGNYMTELGMLNQSVLVVNADLSGTCRNTGFVSAYPDRSFNVGIAEQNLVSFSAGLAHEGFIPFVFSMAPFISMRACEQVRTDVAYASLKVRFMATYAGVSGGISGATHWSIEDCGIMCSIPNMIVLEPCDPIQARKMMLSSLKIDGPVYVRSTIEPVVSVYDESYDYEVGKASVLREGDDGAFICCGITVKYALSASDSIFRKTRKRVRVIDMHTIKPIDVDAVMAAARTGRVVVAHDHNVIGGLGYQVANVLAERRQNPKFINLGVPDFFDSMAHAPYLYHKYGYDSIGLENSMLSLIFGERDE